MEYKYIVFATRTSVAGTFGRTDDVKLRVVWRECQAVRVGYLILADYQVDAAGRVNTIAVGWQLALALAKRDAIGRVGEPVTAVRVRYDVIWRVQPFAIVGIGEHGCSAIVFVAYHLASKV